eukprot:Nk52_evm52s1073 gene=Nk52_evmTU52s1073
MSTALSKSTILLTGATGTVGKALVASLAGAGCNIRCLVRDVEAAKTTLEPVLNGTDKGGNTKTGGATSSLEFIQGDVETGEGLGEACMDAERLFLLTPSLPHQPAVEHSMAQAFKANNVANEKKHIVKLSVLGADVNHHTSALTRWHAWSENAVISTGVPITVLRPNLFMQNIVRDDALHIKAARQFYRSVDVAETKISHVDVRDVAEAAKVCLTAADVTEHAGNTYDITGPMAYTYEMVAETLGGKEVLDTPVRCVELNDSQLFKAVTESGYPPYMCWMLVNLYKMYRLNGVTSRTFHDYTILTGKEPRSLEAFLKENKGVFQDREI